MIPSKSLRTAIFFAVCLGNAFFNVTLFPGDANAGIIHWSSGAGGNDHYYELVLGTTDWQSARTDAQSRTYLGLQGYLFTVTSQEENDFVYGHQDLINRQAGRYVWLGLTDREGTLSVSGQDLGAVESYPSQTNGWRWITGETFSYNNWYLGEPNNYSEEDFGIFNWGDNGQWNDLTEASTFANGYIVEYSNISGVPEPSGLAMFSIAGAGLICRRSKRRVAGAHRETEAPASHASGASALQCAPATLPQARDPL